VRSAWPKAIGRRMLFAMVRRCFIYSLFFFTHLTMLRCGHKADLGNPPQPDDHRTNSEAQLQVNAASIVAYWSSRSDGLEVHITGLDLAKVGNGSFKDLEGTLIPAGKFRRIRYLGGNKWECEQFRHRSLIYPRNPNNIAWEYAPIELLDKNTLRVGNTIYDRQ
jgi:hypothetical protein